MVTCPLLGRSNVDIIRNRVVLPDPFGPTIVVNSPGAIFKVMSFSTCFMPKDLETDLILIIHIYILGIRACLFKNQRV